MTGTFDRLAAFWGGAPGDPIPWTYVMGLVIVLLALVLALVWAVLRARRADRYDEIPLAFPVTPSGGIRTGEPAGRSDKSGGVHTPLHLEPSRQDPAAGLVDSLPDVEPVGGDILAAPGHPPSPSDAALEQAEVYEGKTIRFHRPPPTTLQLIPGRLEVITGEDRDEVIRFVRTPGQPPEITLGRSEGIPLRHIQFRAPTVSRQHARMLYASSRWVISNQSRTNPVVVNGVELVPPIDRHVLADGDEIELGEVVFRFHDR